MIPENGTYELVGPKIQGNPERFDLYEFVRHSTAPIFYDAPRTFDGLREWLSRRDIEGIVWHHPDGRMAKIKKRDFGLERIPGARFEEYDFVCPICQFSVRKQIEKD